MLSSKSMKNGLLRILNNLDSAGQGVMRDKEEGGTGRKEGRGGRRDEERGEKKLLKKKKNEKVAKGPIIGLAGPCLTDVGFSWLSIISHLFCSGCCNKKNEL